MSGDDEGGPYVASVEEIDMHGIAVSLRTLIERHLPKGVRYMLVVTDYEGLGVDGTLPPHLMASACEQVIEWAEGLDDSRDR